jgi:hypothetical protein
MSPDWLNDVEDEAEVLSITVLFRRVLSTADRSAVLK